MIDRGVDVVVTGGDNAAKAVLKVTSRIPIVVAASADPVESGLVASLARPGGMVTGLSVLSTELGAKRLELLKEAVPGLSRVGVLKNPSSVSAMRQWRDTEGAASSFGLALRGLDVRRATDLDQALDAARQQALQAVIVFRNFVVEANKERLIRRALELRIPTIFEQRDFVEAGGLMSYGPSLPELFRRAAVYVDKVLKGAKPGELPVEQPTKFELVVNLGTARALGLPIPQSLLLRADAVIR